jgi:amidase
MSPEGIIPLLAINDTAGAIARIVDDLTIFQHALINKDILNEADKQDKLIKQGVKLGDLFGVFVAVKDNIAVKGMPTTNGSYALRNLYFSEDAQIIKNIKQKSALIIAKTNMSEFSGLLSSNVANGFSALGGHTQNAVGKYDVGGSSSGSAVSVKLNLCTVSIGAETSGSLIYPASQNDVFAIKSTHILMSPEGIIPLLAINDTAGAIARNVDDLTIFQHTLINKESIKSTYSNIKVGIISNKIFDDNSVQYQSVVDSLKGDVEFKKFDFDSDSDAIKMFSSLLIYYASKDFNDFVTKNKDIMSIQVPSFDYIIDENNKKKDEFYYGFDFLELAQKTLKERNSNEMEELSSVVKKGFTNNIEAHFEKYNVDVLFSSGNLLSADYSTSGFPAVTIPVGYRKNGEPIGLTIIGKKNSDDMLLCLAKKISSAIKK